MLYFSVYINDIYVYITFNFVQLIAELFNAHIRVDVIDGGEGGRLSKMLLQMVWNGEGWGIGLHLLIPILTVSV